MVTGSEAAKAANRALHRQGMREFGHELTWLSDPTEIPESVVGSSDDIALRCFNLSAWMLMKMGEWSGSNYRRLSPRETFAEYELEPEEKVGILRNFRECPVAAYAPGFQALNEAHAISPLLAARDGIGIDGWAGIASRARLFSKKLAKDDTEVQTLIRAYLCKPDQDFTPPIHPVGNIILHRMDPARMRLDEEMGIASVTSIDELVATAKEAIEEIVAERRGAKVCVALQSVMADDPGTTFFDAAWDAFNQAAARLVYPGAKISEKIPPQGKPDRHFTRYARTNMPKILCDFARATF